MADKDADPARLLQSAIGGGGAGTLPVTGENRFASTAQDRTAPPVVIVRPRSYKRVGTRLFPRQINWPPIQIYVSPPISLSEENRLIEGRRIFIARPCGSHKPFMALTASVRDSPRQCRHATCAFRPSPVRWAGREKSLCGRPRRGEYLVHPIRRASSERHSAALRPTGAAIMPLSGRVARRHESFCAQSHPDQGRTPARDWHGLARLPCWLDSAWVAGHRDGDRTQFSWRGGGAP